MCAISSPLEKQNGFPHGHTAPDLIVTPLITVVPFFEPLLYVRHCTRQMWYNPHNNPVKMWGPNFYEVQTKLSIDCYKISIRPNLIA